MERIKIPTFKPEIGERVSYLLGDVSTFFPRAVSWDWFTIIVPETTFQPLEKKEIITGKDLETRFATQKGFVHTAVAGANNPKLGFNLRYLGPRRHEFKVTYTIESLYKSGFTIFAPGAWTVTRYGEPEPNEYAVLLAPSLQIPFFRDFSFEIQNFDTSNQAILRSLHMNLLLIWEE